MIAASKRADFADWLSPMLVKELRQGMRSRVFMAAFYFTQILMIVSVVLSLVASANPDDGLYMSSFLHGLFWFLVGIPLLLVMPVRGFWALHGEMKAKTLELIFLTRLSALRIVTGKWTALMAQTLLLICAMLPYVVLRYFLGGVNIVADLQTIFFLFLGSAILTAVTIAMSPYESKIVRALFVLGLVFAMMFLPYTFAVVVSMGYSSGRGVAGPDWTQIFIVLAVFLPALIFFALEMAASKISPLAENHAIRKRLAGLYFILAAAVLAYFKTQPMLVFTLALIVLFFVIMDALSEPQHLVRNFYRPFWRYGFAGRAMARLFTPGWSSANCYVLAIALLCAILFFRYEPMQEARPCLAFLSYFGMLVFPAALIRLIWPSARNFLGYYIGLQVLGILVTILVSMIAEASDGPTALWLSPLPGSIFLLNLFEQVHDVDMPQVMFITALMTGLAMVVLMLRGLAPWRDIRKMLSQTADTDVQR